MLIGIKSLAIQRQPAMYSESVKIKNKRGLNLAAVIHRPNTKEKSACVLVLHGFLGNKEEEHMKGICEGLAAAEFVAIRFDCSGFGESEGDVETDFRVSNYLLDIEDVFDYAKSLSFVDKNNMGICGHSLGGSLALIFTAQHSEIKACCTIQGCTKLTRPGGAIDLQRWQETGWYEELCLAPVKRKVRLPYVMAEDADQFDASLYAPLIKMPTMIMYGSEDFVVKIENILLIHEAAKNCSSELVELKGFDHYFKNDPTKLKVVTDHLKLFFDKHLSVRKQTAASIE